MKVNTKLNIILILFLLEFLLIFWLYMRGISVIEFAEMQLDRADNLVYALLRGCN